MQSEHATHVEVVVMEVDDGVNTKRTCLNLEERFGKRYRIGWEADGPTKSQTPREQWPWLMELLCGYGRIFPKGGEVLQACSDHPRIGAKLRALPGVLRARGDVETVVTFHVDTIKQVFGLLKPYRRRQVSDVERTRLRELSITHGFKRDHSHISESDFSGLGTTEVGG